MKSFRRISYFLIAFTLGFGALYGVFSSSLFSNGTGLFEVRAIPVEMVYDSARGRAGGDARLKGRVESTIRASVGKRIWQIDLGDLRQEIARDEWVQEVLIERSLPNQIQVRVRSRTAALVMVSAAGEFLPVTEDGSLLGALPSGALPDVPLLRGEEFSRNMERRLNAVRLALSFPDRGPISRKNISEMTWSKDDGYSVTLIQPRVEVKLGDEQVELKAMRAAQVVSYLSAHNLRGRVIDASFSKKVLVRLRKGP